MQKLAVGLCAVVALVGLSACAAGSGDAHAAASGGLLSQFFLGLWHGIIAPLTLLVEVVNKLLPGVLPWKPHFFEEGTGVPYDVGFYLTVGGGVHFATRGYRRRV